MNYDIWDVLSNVAEERWERWKKWSTIANYICMQLIRPTNLCGGVASVRSRPTETVNRPLLDECKRR